MDGGGSYDICVEHEGFTVRIGFIAVADARFAGVKQVDLDVGESAVLLF